MTNVEQLAMQMEFDADSRRRLALELIKARTVIGACKRHHTRLPHQVQTALRVLPTEYAIDAPALGDPGLFHEEKTA